MIEFKNIGLAFDGKEVFHDFSVDFQKDKLISISGPSGSGKTTLLKMIPGIVRPDKGEIIIEGQKLNAETIKEWRSKLIYVPQNINLPVRNGEELIELLELEDSKNLIIQNMEILGLSAQDLGKSFQELSGGQKQRVLIAVSLAQEKSIVIMDEPTSALDEKNIERLIQLIHQQEGKTIISSSHNPIWLKASDKEVKL